MHILWFSNNLGYSYFLSYLQKASKILLSPCLEGKYTIYKMQDSLESQTLLKLKATN